MASMKNSNLILSNVRIIHRNFAGREGKYNQEGQRSFSVLIDEDLAAALAEDNWNVKWMKPREEGDIPQAYLPVAVSYRVRSPRVVLVTSRGHTNLNEDEVEAIDWVDITNVDMSIRPRSWVDNDGAVRVKAYLKSIFVTVDEDELDLKYAEIDELGGHPRAGRVDE